MIKRILLGLLLVPCISHAMEKVLVYKNENEKSVSYRKDNVCAGYIKATKEYYAVEVERSGGQSVMLEEKEVFEELQQEYAQQKTSKKE